MSLERTPVCGKSNVFWREFIIIFMAFTSHDWALLVPARSVE